MTDSLGDLLQKFDRSEPPEIQIIKEYVKEHIGIEPGVAITKAGFIVSLPNSSAAGTLRFKLFQLQRQLGHERKIIIKTLG